MYHSCMATKTISIELDVYERLKALKRAPSESFSQVLRRSLPQQASLSASELLSIAKEPGGILKVSEDQLRQIETVREKLSAWKDPWK